MTRAVALGAAALLIALPGEALEVGNVPTQSPRSGAIEFKLGTYKPRVDDEANLNGATPFSSTFGGNSMLLFQLEIERFLYQGIGSAGLGFSGGYAEKYGDTKTTTGETAAEKTAFKVIPLQVSALYKFDYAAFHWGVPLVPYAQLGLIYTPWWTTKGDATQLSGGTWGYGLTAGLSFMLDVLEPRLARDFDTDVGVNHSYIFAEYSYSKVNDFGGDSLNLSSGHWMFGLALDY
jgi:hypothetical protein